MFAAECPAEGRTVLLSAGNITRLERTADGFRIEFTCWCGVAGARLIRGRSAAALVAGADAATSAALPPQPR